MQRALCSPFFKVENEEERLKENLKGEVTTSLCYSRLVS